MKKLDEKYEYLKKYAKYSEEIETLEQLDVNYTVICRIQMLQSNCKRILDCICNVKDSNARNMLIQKYVLGRTNEKIAERTAYSVRTVQRFIRQGVEELVIISLPYQNL